MVLELLYNATEYCPGNWYMRAVSAQQSSPTARDPKPTSYWDPPNHQVATLGLRGGSSDEQQLIIVISRGVEAGAGAEMLQKFLASPRNVERKR